MRAQAITGRVYIGQISGKCSAPPRDMICASKNLGHTSSLESFGLYVHFLSVIALQHTINAVAPGAINY